MSNFFSWLSDAAICFYLRHFSKFFGPSLQKTIENHKGNLVYKWEQYIEVYEKYLAKYRGIDFIFVEVGVFQGGSLQIWRKYFGPRVRIYGIDIDKRCLQFQSKKTQVLLSNQASAEEWKRFKSNMYPIDVFIDDGGHTMEQQIVTFNEMFPHVKDGGVYICEDLHTSYWSDYAGGYRKPSTFIEFSKTLVDSIHAWHSREKDFAVDQWSKSIKSINFYNSIVVIEKQKMDSPKTIKYGTDLFNDNSSSV